MCVLGGVQPACLPVDNEEAATSLRVSNLRDGLDRVSLTVVGWGHTSPSDDLNEFRPKGGSWFNNTVGNNSNIMEYMI